MNDEVFVMVETAPDVHGFVDVVKVISDRETMEKVRKQHSDEYKFLKRKVMK